MHHGFPYLAMTFAITLETQLQRHVEEDGVHFVAESAGHLDPLPTLMRRQVGGIDIIHRTFGDKAGAKQRAQGREDETLIALLGLVIEEKLAQGITGERHHSASLEPGG